MKKTVLMAIIPVFIITSTLMGKTMAGPLATWSAVDWGTVDSEIDDRLNSMSGKGRSANENLDVSTGVSMEIPADTLRKVAGKNLTLAFHTGDGIAISTSGREMKSVEHGLNIMITDGEETALKDACQRIVEGALYSKMFAMEEKAVYDIHLNIHFSVGQEYAGKYANLYHYDEQKEQMVCDGSFVVTDGGMAMFSLSRGDEYLLTVTENLPVGGKIGYTVVSGDNLSKIAARNKVSVKEILAANPKIENADMIFAGQKITIMKM